MNSHQISWGLFDIFAYSKLDENSTSSRLNIFAPSLLNFSISKDWSISAIYLQTAYLTYKDSSDFADFDISNNSTSSSIRVGFLTTTYSWTSLHLELGGAMVNELTLPTLIYFGDFMRFSISPSHFVYSAHVTIHLKNGSYLYKLKF